MPVGLALALTATAAAQIIDHRCLAIDKIPPDVIAKIGKEWRIAYGHTSHGSQIVAGMTALRNAMPDKFNFSTARSAAPGVLSLWDATPRGDLGNPDRSTWALRTREMLTAAGCDRNMVVWSWCGQVSKSTPEDITLYLNTMSQLEKEFPKIKFVYMTGHLDGSGEKGKLHQRNQQIRDFCRKNHKLLFDFADIESYSPDGDVNYLPLNARDDCSYKSDGQRRNWAAEWLEKHPDHKWALPPSAAHTQPLNGAMKGRAFWWLLAVASGWQPPAGR